MESVDQFAKKKYLNIETFRKNGTGVKTPVWFVQNEGTIYVHTGANSGKVKRIRNSNKVNIVPCKMDGTPIGKWVPANVLEIRDEKISIMVDHLLDKKYGLIKKLFGVGADRKNRQDTILEIKLV